MKSDIETIVTISKALSDKSRIKILSEIARRKNITCGEAEKISGLSQPTVSHHLKVLNDAGLLNSVKDGKFSIISVNMKVLADFNKLILNEIKT